MGGLSRRTASRRRVDATRDGEASAAGLRKPGIPDCGDPYEGGYQMSEKSIEGLSKATILHRPTGLIYRVAGILYNVISANEALSLTFL